MNKTKKCKKSLSFEQCELQTARVAISTAMHIKAHAIASSPKTKAMTAVVEDFLRKTKCVCYGGAAINNLLPSTQQFYNLDTQVPDYDMYSPNPMHHAKLLVDIYHKKGFKHAEASSAQHVDTYKVFVDFTPVADITMMEPALFKAVSKEAILKNGILYADPNLLRQNMYVELSRPDGDIERWNKVLPRLASLNAQYPMSSETCALQQPMMNPMYDFKEQNALAALIENNFAAQKVMFIGGFADSLYAEYMKPSRKIHLTPDYDVVSETPYKSAQYLVEELIRSGYTKVRIAEHKPVGDLIAKHYEIFIGKDTVAFVYGAVACHSYNLVELHGNELRIATIDTLLSFYLAFLYVNRVYMKKDRILCMASLLFQVQRQNMFEQKGLLKRFSLSCYGTQPTDFRKRKTEMRARLKRGTPEYERWFFFYRPN